MYVSKYIYRSALWESMSKYVSVYKYVYTCVLAWYHIQECLHFLELY